jgi:crotonobetainyl-CoA:carnitine CoA-transferase CaiB-like acyl-CoA transferase
MGADVIKIEAPSMGGDVSRATGPYFLGRDDSMFFQTFSRAKSSAAVELKDPAGRAVFEEMVRDADAVVNNLRGDQPAKLRLRHQDLMSLNPAVVCAHLSAYGRDTSREAWPGYDYLMQAEAGFMALTGEPDAPPTRFGLSMVDFMTGTMFALAIVSAVLKARDTHVGCDVDVSLFDVALHQLSYPAVWALNGGHEVGRLARGAHPSIAPSQLVRTRDGWAMLMCQTQKFWEVLCARAGRPDLAGDPRFVDIPARRANLAALSEALDAMFAAHTTREWLELIGGFVPFAPVNGLREALDNPFVAEVAMRDVVDHPDAPAGRLNMLASPIKVNGVRAAGRRAPKLGERLKP